MAYRKRKPTLAFTAFLLLLVFVPIAWFVTKNPSFSKADWYNPTWLYRKQLVFNNLAQASNLTNFPVLVTLSASNFTFAQAQSAGQDIRFTDSDGTTLLAYEFETYDSVGQTARIWVNVPQINASSNTDFIFIYWGNSAATDAQSADNTWNSNYKGVYHLNDNAASTTVTDSSGLANTVTAAENTNNGFYQAAGKIGGSVLTGGTPTYITNQSGQNLAEAYPDIALDSSGFPVIAYTDNTNADLILVHCNDKECKGGNETVSNVDSTNSTGYYPSIQLDSNGYPMIAYYYGTGADLKYVHCNDVNCAGANETFSSIDTTNTTGQFPRMVKDGAGYPVIAYYYGTGLDLKIVHCGNADCNSGNVINSIDTGGTVGNGLHNIDVVLDASGYPVVSYYDTTNTELKVAHCNDANCSGGDEAINSPLNTLAKSIGIYTAIEIDGGGLPMIAYFNATDLNLEFLHCNDANCAGDETAQRVIVSTGLYDYFPAMEKNNSGIPVIVVNRYGYILNVFVCANTNCSSSTLTFLSYYNQQSSYPYFKLDANNNLYIVAYSQGKTGDWDVVFATTYHKLERAYDSDFDFGTGSFSVSAWFKSNGMVQKNTLLSRYDADQGFKFELNYAGQACFSIDDDASWNPDDSACSSNSQVITDVDNGNMLNASWQSMVLDSSGYPIIAYYDSNGTQLNLEIIHCNDANCTGNNETYASIDSTGDVGAEMSLVLDGSGFPVISYHDNTNQDLKIVHCGNANCSSGNTINTLDSGGDVGDYSTVKLDGSGYPVVSYYDTTNTAVKLVHCNDALCAGADESVVTLVNDEDDRVQQGTESLQLDTSGYPIVAYFDNTNGDLKLIHCNDANCDGVGETKTTVESTNWVGSFASMTLDANGYPVIIHFDYTSYNLRLVHCGNANCSAGNTISVINYPNNAYSGVYELDIKLNASGNPVILSYQSTSWAAVLTICNDVNCAGDNETNSLLREGLLYNYYYHSLALDSNSYPVITYSASGNDLRLIHMTNGTTYTESGNYDDSQWHHLVGVKNGTSSITLYIDGVAVATDSAIAATGTLTSNSASLNLAEEITNTLSVNNWTGYLDEVQLDTTARSSAWVAAEYLSESNNFINVQATQNRPSSALSTFTNNSGALKNNLIGYWKFDEGFGTTANNSGSGGSVINGSISGSTWSQSGKFGKALNFDGVNDRINLSANSALNFDASGQQSISLWFNAGSLRSSPAGSTNRIFTKEGTTKGYIFTIFNDLKLGLENPNGWGNIKTTATLSPNQWYHAVAIYNNQTVTLYLNGILQTTSGTPGTFVSDSTSTAYVGGNADNYQLSGLIDEVKIYNAALTAAEVKQDYNHGSALSMGSISDTSGLAGGSVASNSASAAYCVPGGTDTCAAPAGEWNFEEGTGGTANDITGNGNTGTWTGTIVNQWAVGKFGKAGKFNGNNYVTVSNNPIYNNATKKVSVGAWIYPTASSFSSRSDIFTAQENGVILSTGNSPANKQLQVWYWNSSTWPGCNTASNTLTQDQWNYISTVIDVDANLFKIYINGIEKGSCSVSGDIAWANKHITIGSQDASRYFSGSIDGVKLYNYARTPAQIAWDYNQGKPIGWWKLNECSGTIANDSSGNQNTGTITIGATGTNTTAGTCLTSGAWFDGATGKFGASMDFDGTDDYVQLSNTISLPTTGLTISAWIKVASLANSTNYNIFSKQTWGSKLGFRLALGGYGGCINLNCLFLGVGDGVNQNETSSTIYLTDTGTWHHVVGTFSSGAIKLYLDGNQRLSTTALVTSIVNDAVAARIGKHSTGNEPFPGQIDDVRIYNYALSPAQIKQVYNEGSAVRFGP